MCKMLGSSQGSVLEGGGINAVGYRAAIRLSDGGMDNNCSCAFELAALDTVDWDSSCMPGM